MKYTVRMKQAIAPGIVNARVMLGNASAKNVNAAVAATLAKRYRRSARILILPRGIVPYGMDFGEAGEGASEQRQNIE
jgi:hypothetical protein